MSFLKQYNQKTRNNNVSNEGVGSDIKNYVLAKLGDASIRILPYNSSIGKHTTDAIRKIDTSASTRDTIINVKGISSYLYFNKQPLTSSDDILNVLEQAVDYSKQFLKIDNLIREALKLKFTPNDDQTVEDYWKSEFEPNLFKLIKSNIDSAFVAKLGNPKLQKGVSEIKTCQDLPTVKDKLLEAIGNLNTGAELLEMFYDGKYFIQNKGSDISTNPNGFPLTKSVNKLFELYLGSLLGNSYQFLKAVAEWLVRSVRKYNALNDDDVANESEVKIVEGMVNIVLNDDVTTTSYDDTTERGECNEPRPNNNGVTWYLFSNKDVINQPNKTTIHDGVSTESISTEAEAEEGTDVGKTEEVDKESTKTEGETNDVSEIPEKTSEETEEENKERPTYDSEQSEVTYPDENIAAIKEYLAAMLAENINEITAYTAGEVNRPLYHISMNNDIKRFVPKVSNRTCNKEDRSVPRISTSTSLVGCFNGYQSMLSDMEGRKVKNFNGLFTVYNLPFQYAIKPSYKLLPDVEVTDEYWLISWKRETYGIEPDKVAEFTIPKIETVYGSDGKDTTYHIYINVKTDKLYIDHEKCLDRGYYHLIFKGYNFNYPLSKNANILVERIKENEYIKVTSLSIMLKKR